MTVVMMLVEAVIELMTMEMAKEAKLNLTVVAVVNMVTVISEPASCPGSSGFIPQPSGATYGACPLPTPCPGPSTGPLNLPTKGDTPPALAPYLGL